MEKNKVYSKSKRKKKRRPNETPYKKRRVVTLLKFKALRKD